MVLKGGGDISVTFETKKVFDKATVRLSAGRKLGWSVTPS
jgi:hypothetical protein